MTAVTWGPPAIPVHSTDRAVSLDARRRWETPVSPRRAASPPVSWSLRVDALWFRLARPAGRHVAARSAR